LGLFTFKISTALIDQGALLMLSKPVLAKIAGAIQNPADRDKTFGFVAGLSFRI